MKVRAIVVDLDRTLLRTDKTISPYTTEVLRACRRRGIGIMVATARPIRTARQFCDAVEFDAMVVSNGARVIRGNQQTEYGICPESAQRLLGALKRHPDFRVTLETGDCAYSNFPIEDYETVICEDLVSAARREGAVKILVHLDSGDTLGIVKKELTDDLYYTVAHGRMMQIMNKAATKWNGVQAMLEDCGCLPEEAAYFGDDQDDVEPIRRCGMGIAVSNGIDEARAAADYIAGSNDEDGVARFIESRLL